MHSASLPLDRPPTLGIDIGRVIIGAVDDNGRADTSFLSGTLERAMQTPPTPHAFDCIARLTRAFRGAVWLVSKCGPRVQDKTRRWLAHWGFWDRTGIASDHLRFCLKRPEKALHCAELGVTHFIDDRVDVLEHLRGLVPHLYLFGADWKTRTAPAWATPVITWPEVVGAIAGSSDARSRRIALDQLAVVLGRGEVCSVSGTAELGCVDLDPRVCAECGDQGFEGSAEPGFTALLLHRPR